MDIALNFIEGLITRVGVPVTICAVAIYIALDSYFFWKGKVSNELDEMRQDIDNVEHCSNQTVEILGLMADKQEKHFRQCHDFEQELHHKLLNGGR